MNRPTRSLRPACPACGGSLVRARRLDADRHAILDRGKRRYRCLASECGWGGLLPKPRRASWTQDVASLARSAWPAVLAVGALATSMIWWSQLQDDQQAVLVGPHVVLPGTHLEGDRLPDDHPLLAAVSAQAGSAEPAAEATKADALQLRRHCAWGIPGRKPYRGSVEQALQAVQLPAEVIKVIAADVRAGRKSDRVTISNAAIRADGSGHEYDTEKVALTYGMTMCVDARVNFRRGHVEKGDLFVAQDEQGRNYAVMVPDVCGNVSVLGERAELPEDGPEGSVLGVRRELPLPSTLSLVAAALAVLLMARRRR